MTDLKIFRYFVPDSDEFAPGWYQTRNEGRTRIGDVPLSLSDALYDGPNRLIIDSNTPETNTLPVSGGKGVDEFLITRTANSVVIDDDSGANVIVFERDVVITSIERQAGSEGASVAQYVITLSSGKTITLRNPASFTFQHLGDATRTAPISAEDFVTAYEDGFAASDASHPDIIGDASDFTGAAAEITGTVTGAQIMNAVYEGDLSTSGGLDVSEDTLLASTTPFTISTQGTYGTASIDDDGEWVYKLDNGNTDVRALNSGDTLTDTFVVDVNLASGRATTQTVTITIRGRTDVLGTNGPDVPVGDAGTSDNQAIFGFNSGNARNSSDTLTGGSGDDLLVGGYGFDRIDLRAGGADTVVYRINSSDTDGFIKAEDGLDRVFGFTPGEDKLVILDVNGSPMTLAALFDNLTKDAFELRRLGDDDRNGNLSSSELDDGARVALFINFEASGTSDGGPTSPDAGSHLRIDFDRVTSEALNDMAVWDTLTGGTNFSSDTISTVAQLNSLFGGFGRPGYDAALDDGGFISTIGPDDLPDSYFEFALSGDETGSVTEGGAPGDDNTGTLTASGAVITLVSKEITDSPGTSTGTYGVMTFDGTTWTYTLDDRAEALADQQTETETFTFNAGGETLVVTITITGVNDAPVVESGNEIGEQAGRVGQEITAIDLSGLFTDADTGDTFTLTVMVLSSDGSAKSRLDTLGLEYDSDTKMITGTLLDSIAAGPYTIEVIATDGGGSGAASQPSTFDIVVAPDIAPVIGGAMDGTIAEDAADPLTGTLTITDAEGDALPMVELSSGAGQYGTLTFVASADGGVWTYTLDNTNAAVQALKGGTLEDNFTFTAEGAEDVTVTITISGVNDAPVVESGNEIGEQAGRVGQAITAIDLSGLFTDVDTGDTFTLTVMVLSSDGSTKSGLDTLGLGYDSGTKMITGTLLNSVAARTYTIEVIATDGGGSGAASQPSTFDIVVAPDNAPVIGGAMDGTIAEDVADPLTGTLTITDADGDALPMVVLTDGAGQYGTLTFVASAEGGVWTYRLDNANAAVQALKGGTLEDNFTFTAEGAAPITVTITISGVNDAPVVESGNEIVEQAGQVGQEITAIDLSSLFTDVDTGDTLTLIVMVLSSDGSKSGLDTLGLEYDSDTKMITGTLSDSIPTGPYTIEVIATDGSGAASQPSTFDIVVVADGAPVIGGAVDGTIAEDAAAPLTGTLTITDADGDALPMVVLTDGAGQYGTLTFVASAEGGVWTYRLDNANAAVQALKGDTLTDNFTFTAEGAAPITVTITITGVNDAPVVESGNEIGEQTGQAGQEITAIDLSGLFTDVDTDDTFTLTVMVLSSDGSTKSGLDTLGLEYDSDTKMITGTLLNSVVAGTYTIEVIATDGGGSGAASQPSTFDIVVAPDNPPVIGGEVDGTIAEDVVDSTGTLTITDADGDALPMVVLTDGAGQYGTLTFVASAEGGVWTYRLNNTNPDVQALKGDTLEDNFTFTAEGADPITVTITISGVNDAPVVESGNEIVEQAGRVGQEIKAIDLSGLFTDVDAGDSFTLTVMVLAGSTRLGLDTALGLTYDPVANAITGTIRSDVSAGPYTIEVIATDGGGRGAASQPSTFDIVVAPDNAPVIGGAVDGTIAEDVVDSTGTLTITDAEGDTLPMVVLTDGAGQYGTLTFVASADGGVWTYRLNNANPAVQALKGDTLEDNFTFTAEGADPITVTITISGVNDVPVVESGNEIGEQAGRVGQAITAIDLSGLFTDVDTGDTFTLTVMVLSSDGSTKSGLDTLGLEYDSDTKMITGTLLNSVSAGPYTIEVIATDGGGGGAASQPSTFDIVVAADNPPVIGGEVDGTIAEDAADPITGTLTITDAEGDALPTVALTDGVGQYGTLTFDVASGVWTYTLNSANADVQALKDNALTDAFTFTAEGAEDVTVTITISGVNDAPVVESGNEIDDQTGRVGQEITAIDLSGLFTDVDAGDSYTLTVMVLSSDGNTRTALDTTLGLEYDSDTKMITGTLLNSVVAGPYTIEVIATDGGGRGAASQPSTFDIVVAPDNAPVIGGAVDGTIAEDVADPLTGTLTITDAEGDALPMVVLTDGAGQYGTLTFVASAEGGVWTYRLDNANAAVQALKGDTLEDNFTFIADGADPITVTITITGANDAPVVATAIEPQSGVDGREKVIDLSTLFTDVDEGDELTFTVTLDDGAALSTIGLTYNSDNDKITGTLTGTGTYVIKIVVTDKSGATVETTFDLNISVLIIQRNSLTYNPDATSIIIDETMLKVTSANTSDPALLVYTITTLPDAGMLLKSGTQLNNGDTFTQADINNGLITYVPSVSDSSTSQSNPLSFTLSDGVATLEDTLQITSREVFEDASPDQDNMIDRSGEAAPQKIEAGDGSDDITGSRRDDQMDGGAGDDEIKLTRTVNNAEEDAGVDEVLYAFDYDGVGIDGGDEIVGFKRGQDKLTFVINRDFNNLTAFLKSLNGDDQTDLTADDAFIVTMQWGTDSDGDFYFDGVLLHFKDVLAFGDGRVSSPVVQITFDEQLDFDDLVGILGGKDKVAENFDFTHAAFKNLDEVLPRLFGEGSIGFKFVAPSGTNGASERASEEPLKPPIYETLSEQLDDIGFELNNAETYIV